MQDDFRDTPPPGRIATLLVWLGVAIEVAAVVAQVVLIYLLRNSRFRRGCGEQCAWESMGLLAIMSTMLPLILVGSVAALALAFRARRARTLEGASRFPYAMHATIAALPLLVVAALVESDRPLPVSAPKVADAPVETRDDQFVAGAAYATDEGIADPHACKGPSASFIAGCTRVAVRQRAATTSSGASIRGMTAR
jgi:hypothetical protein